MCACVHIPSFHHLIALLQNDIVLFRWVSVLLSIFWCLSSVWRVFSYGYCHLSSLSFSHASNLHGKCEKFIDRTFCSIKFSHVRTCSPDLFQIRWNWNVQVRFHQFSMPCGLCVLVCLFVIYAHKFMSCSNPKFWKSRLPFHWILSIAFCGLNMRKRDCFSCIYCIRRIFIVSVTINEWQKDDAYTNADIMPKNSALKCTPSNPSPSRFLHFPTPIPSFYFQLTKSDILKSDDSKWIRSKTASNSALPQA